MKHVSSVSIILENMENEVLLLLRDSNSSIYPKHWTLVGGSLKNGETPEMAAQRALEEETGLKTDLALWKQYERNHPLFLIDQYIYTGRVDSYGLLVLGRDTQFFKPCEIKYLKIGYGFDALLDEYLLIREQ
jgi:8-oxo-dGTP pyrophosphatase MutT (NUDIX family)